MEISKNSHGDKFHLYSNGLSVFFTVYEFSPIDKKRIVLYSYLGDLVAIVSDVDNFLSIYNELNKS